jgi:hypothetical protein
MLVSCGHGFLELKAAAAAHCDSYASCNEELPDEDKHANVKKNSDSKCKDSCELEVHDTFCIKQQKKRAVLTHHQAIAIFEMRGPFYESTDCSRDRAFTSRSVMVSRVFGISPKAVRDIWNKRTWRHCTQALWTEDDVLLRTEYVRPTRNDAAQTTKATTAQKRVGRPRGSKDSKPRRTREKIKLFFGAAANSNLQDLLVDDFRDGVVWDTAAFDSDTAQPIHPVDRCDGTVKVDEGYMTSRIASPASSAGLELDGEDDLNRSFPFFLDVSTDV